MPALDFIDSMWSPIPGLLGGSEMLSQRRSVVYSLLLTYWIYLVLCKRRQNFVDNCCE
jgi:hypothetical protein